MLQKRLDYGSSGYHVPFVPRARRSARRRGLVQKKVEDNQLCAFDLLATIAGNLLEGESSHETLLGTDFSNVQNENVKRENTEAASPPLNLELGIRGLGQDIIVKESPEPLPDASLALEKNGSLEKIDLNEPSGLSPDLYCRSGEIEGHSQGYIDPCVPFVVEDGQCCVNGGEGLIGDCSDSHNLEDPEILDRKSPVVSSDGSVKLTLGNDYYPCSSLSPCRDNNNNVNLVSRDDDENSSECIQPSTIKTARSPACIGDRKIRKLLDSKYWRIASKARDGDLTDSEVRSLSRSRKTGYKRQGSKRIYPFKRRKYYRHRPLSSARAEISYKDVYNYSDKAIFSMGVNGSSACSAGQSATFSSRESHVKLKIKSFRVPELFIEMPETATIGSLKRTVMEAFSALLGGGLRVGVHLQGKKIRDDNRTLLQSGLCNDNKAESLGFSLEPNPSQIGPPVCCKKSSPVLTPDVPQAVSRCPITSSIHQGTSHHITDHPATNLGNIIESDHDSALFPANLPTGKDMVDSRSLVALPDGTPQPLAVSYSHQKFKRSDLGQRRIRRPFSVSEVEALVHAVEKLGTGRWRDVKLLAFDNVKHRTYVDLKDKWKTLVHTAQIAPQQRRGEPVPQELLDRVLAAHGYWTHQQTKLQIQPPPTEHVSSFEKTCYGGSG